MSFDWKAESKERYFQKAEELVKAAGHEDMLEVDKSAFAVSNECVKVYFKSFSRRGNARKWESAKKKLKNISEWSKERRKKRQPLNDIYIHACMTLELEEQDK